ncbi:MAG TPA: hypothetical protein VJ825_04985 [Gemmatimonadaceae bacterium]|nr:hypothetical protein [Gemmatimonadaceae bacterium]
MTRFVGMSFLALAMACSSSTGTRNLSFQGRSTVAPAPPMTVETVVTVRNVGDKTTQIGTNTCGQPLRAYSTPDRTGTWVWQSYDPAAVNCAAVATFATLAPGDYYDFHFDGTIPSTLPSGVYYLAVNIAGRQVPAGQFSK